MRADDDDTMIQYRDCAVCGLHKPSYFRDLLRCEQCSHQKKCLRESIQIRYCAVCGLQQLPNTAFSNKQLDNAPLVGYLRCKKCVSGKKHTDNTLHKQLLSTQHRGIVYNENYVTTNVRRMLPNIDVNKVEHSVDTPQTSQSDRCNGSGGRGDGRGSRSGRGRGRRKRENGRATTPVYHHLQQSVSAEIFACFELSYL